jgi:pimeloyl-ACP methyl ester carboxylesterase
MREGLIEVRDGRKVAYAEFGDPTGTPVLVCHGSAESRLLEIEPEWTAAQGLRVITPDRPGFGGSEPLEDRSVLGWADDAADLADAIGIDQFSTLGWSGGGPHALAVAFALGERVRSVALVGSFAPIALVPGAYDALPPTMRVLADLAPTDPRGTAALVAEVAKEWVADPDSFSLGGESPPEDVAIEAHPVWGPNLRAQIHEGLRRADGIAWDATALHAEWSFAVDAVVQPTDVWHGRSDAVMPLRNGEWLARSLPNATLHVVDGAHFIIFSHWRDILTTLVGRAGSR